MAAKCFAEGGKIVEVKEGKCSSCGRSIYYRHRRKVRMEVRK